jgi:hypothetical protein
MKTLGEIIKESGLEESKALVMLNDFNHYELVASEWKRQAETIVVKSGDDKEQIRLAREGRLILRDKRIEVEKRRKAMKEDSLREGQAIDAVAKFLKDLIDPIEKYLDTQERFVEIQAAEELAKVQEMKRLQLAKEEEERIAAERIENDRIRKENDRLNEESKKMAKELFESIEKEERLKQEVKDEKEAASKREADLKLRVIATEMAVEKISEGIECPKCGFEFSLT